MAELQIDFHQGADAASLLRHGSSLRGDYVDFLDGHQEMEAD